MTYLWRCIKQIINWFSNEFHSKSILNGKKWLINVLSNAENSLSKQIQKIQTSFKSCIWGFGFVKPYKWFCSDGKKEILKVINCYIFRPLFGCCALQVLVEICNFKKIWTLNQHLGTNLCSAQQPNAGWNKQQKILLIFF